MQMKGFRGFLIDTPARGKLRGVRDGAIVIGEGKILATGNYGDLRDRKEFSHACWQYSSEAVIIPGLVDIHTHLPQYPAVARYANRVLPWLERHVYPMEREFNASTARNLAPVFFETLARHGTTCATIYAAIYEDSCDEAFRAAENSRLRITLGKVMMDDTTYNNFPKDKALATSLSQSERLCRKWHGKSDGLLHYAFSPRFAAACSREMMREAASLAKKFDAYIQTHLSENLDEVDFVRQRFPECTSYTDVYASCDILGDRTILGHCIHLSNAEVEQLTASQSAVAHCPTSNLFLGSGIMPLNDLQDAGLRIGLGSDVAAGPEINMWQVMRSTIESQQARSFYKADVRVPTPVDAFFLATQGGAESIGMDAIIGTLDTGKDADFLILDPAKCLPAAHPTRNMLSDLSAADIISLLVYRGGAHSIVETFVRGKSVYCAPNPLLF